MSEPIIRVRGLTRRFGNFTAVDHVDLEVERGSVFAFLGANGSGKSTTIRMLIGLLQPSEGEVVVDGVDVIREPGRVRQGIGYMGQKVSLYQGLSLRENVEFYAGLYGLAGRRLEERWGEVRERFSLAGAEAERPENLPAGLRQRAGLALSTLHHPRLLFLDEPTAGVDVESRGLFWDRIRDQADAGVTVFVTTHFLDEAEYCDRVSFIDAGRLVADDTPEGLRARYSDGYALRCRVSPERRAGALGRLEAAGFRVLDGAGGDDGLRLGRERLDAGAFRLLREVLGPEALASCRVEVPSMNGVFERIMSEAGAAAQQAGAG
jgi:ABC-2 type transport system ATP-binding protein